MATHERIPRFSEWHTNHLGMRCGITVYEEPGSGYSGEWVCSHCGEESIERVRYPTLDDCISAMREAADAHTLTVHREDHDLLDVDNLLDA